MTFDCKVHFNDTSSGILHVIHKFPEEVTGEVIMGKTSGAQKNASHGIWSNEKLRIPQTFKADDFRDRR